MKTAKNKTTYKFIHPQLGLENALSLKPKSLGTIPKLAVLLGLLSPQFYDIYQICDGEKTIQSIAEELKLDSNLALMYIDKLTKSKMLEI